MLSGSFREERERQRERERERERVCSFAVSPGSQVADRLA